MSYRDVPAVAIAPNRIEPIRGEPGKLMWLPIDKLVIDTRYQREITEHGRVNIRGIGERFDWRRFAPLMCAPIIDPNRVGYFAVIDGQHRAGGAKARGDIETIPCWVVDAMTLEQAHAFMAINATSTHVATTAVWYARLAANDPDAMAAFDVCKRAGVHVLRSSEAVAQRTAHQTVAITEIHKARVLNGDAPVVKALKVLVRAGQLRGRCLLTRSFIRASVLLCATDWKRIEVGSAAISLRAIEPDKIEARAVTLSRKDGRPRTEHVVTLLRDMVAKGRAA
ncbi:MAG: hypothetical protein GC190_20485 [Alphaproteobacteria bacterium]|nr:hypothetical protein [Alphaproteobacteria bacterium]